MANPFRQSLKWLYSALDLSGTEVPADLETDAGVRGTVDVLQGGWPNADFDLIFFDLPTAGNGTLIDADADSWTVVTGLSAAVPAGGTATDVWYTVQWLAGVQYELYGADLVQPGDTVAFQDLYPSPFIFLPPNRILRGHIAVTQAAGSVGFRGEYARIPYGPKVF